MIRTYVFDSYALLAFFQDETGADAVRELILSAELGDVNLAMCVVNLGEVWYAIARKQSAEVADDYANAIQGMAIEVVEVDWVLARQAAIYKVKGNISYADCYVAALAKLRKGNVVTGDKEFEILADDVKITWLK